MKDLASRLRSIVRQDHGGRQAPVRELTYVPDAPEPVRRPEAAADALGGTILDGGGCIVIDRHWQDDDWHGRRKVGGLVPDPSAPLHLFDPRAAATPAWSRRIVFFDLETTGLSGGAGTLAFLAGCGWFDGDGFIVRQFFLAGPAGERGMLDALGHIFSEASLLVTFNGRTFDVPLMETRWAFHRTSAPTDDLPHFDMLPPARRLWGRREAWGEREPATSCSLSVLERSILGVQRIGDVPGFEIPSRYFHFLRSGDAAGVEAVLEHNRYDLLSLAGLMTHALQLVEQGPDACRDDGERLALGRLYDRAGDRVRAEQAFRAAAASSDADLRSHALARLATLLRQQRRYDESAAAWRGVIDLADGDRRPFSALERRATEALAIHHEHRERDLAQARQFAARLKQHANGRVRRDAEHRLGRIDRKMRGSEGATGGRLEWDRGSDPTPQDDR